jgi:hypothetical protein
VDHSIKFQAREVKSCGPWGTISKNTEGRHLGMLWLFQESQDDDDDVNSSELKPSF